jgi:uncharacterized membrane protein
VVVKVVLGNVAGGIYCLRGFERGQHVTWPDGKPRGRLVRPGRITQIATLDHGSPSTADPLPSLLTAAHVVYALHSLSILIGITTAATIIGAFVFGVPSIVAVAISYVKRGEARGTFLASHFRWQIRTFWFALLWCVIGGVLLVTIVGIPLAFAVFLGAGVWAIYRIARGWLALRDRIPMYASR